MKESQYNWSFSEEKSDFDTLIPELNRLNLAPELASFLWNRNIRDSQKVESFFKPQVSDFHDPFLLYDMEKAITRIQEAVEKGERILVYGDYDADGITSATVMKEAIELIGGDVFYYLPNRFTDGYGPNLAVYKKMIEEGVQLIITVDNGISGHEAIDYAMSQGVDVIVTDHHEIPETLPNAYAIIHPRHPSGQYPFNDLAGVGVAFKVATALLGEIPVESLDLVALGTIADLVSLTDENRGMVKIGLEVMKQTERIGLQALAEAAKVDLSEVTEETIGFTIAPRLNAIGRLGDANPGVNLLSTFDEEEATNLADFIQNKNTERQAIVKKITAEALEMASQADEEPILFLYQKDWHEGVLGIVASQVVQATGKPTIVLRLDPETGNLKGSGRSINSVDLFKALNIVKEELISFGGHHMAVGLSFSENILPGIKEKLKTYLIENKLIDHQKTDLSIDETIKVADITVDFIETLRLLAPFGTDNPSPHFLINGNEVANFKQIGADGTHLKGQIIEDSATIDCIAFNKGNELPEFEQGGTLTFVGQLSVNEWNGFRKPQLMLTDYQVDGYQLFDVRGKKWDSLKPTGPKTGYLLFNSDHKKMVETKEEDTILLTDKEMIDFEKINDYEDLVIVDCPYDLELAKKVFSNLSVKRIYLKADVNEDHYLTGLPTRNQFGQLFKFIATYPSIDVRYKLNEMSTYLKIEKKLLIFMIQVFFDLGFVTINDGLMTKVDNPTNQPLQESKIYQAYQNKIEMEKLFLYSDIKEIKQWVLHQEEVK